MPLATQADLEAFLQIDFTTDPDPIVTYLIQGADALVIDYLGYNPEDEDGITEVHDPSSTPNLWVRRPPIRALTSVVVDGVTVDSDNYVAYGAGEKSGLIRRLSGRWGGPLQATVVTYDGGYAPFGTGGDFDLPATIRDASVRIAARAFEAGSAFAAEGHTAGVRSIALAGSDTITWSDGAEEAAEKAMTLTPSVRQMLAPHKLDWVS